MNDKDLIEYDFGILINKITTNPNDEIFNNPTNFKIASDALDSFSVDESLDKISLAIKEKLYELKIYGNIRVEKNIEIKEIPKIIIDMIEKNRFFISSKDFNNGIYFTELKLNDLVDMKGNLDLSLTENINKIRFGSNEVIIVNSDYYINNKGIRKVWFNDLSYF